MHYLFSSLFVEGRDRPIIILLRRLLEYRKPNIITPDIYEVGGNTKPIQETLDSRDLNSLTLENAVYTTTTQVTKVHLQN